MRRGCLGALLLILVALVVPSGPGVQAQAVPRTLKIAIGVDGDTLDPAGQTTTTVSNILDYFYEPLVAFDYKQNKVVPLLATSWVISRDGLTFTFKLRTDVKFHDGTPFNAEAVKFTFDRLLDPKVRVPLRFLVDAIKETQVIDQGDPGHRPIHCAVHARETEPPAPE